LVLVLLLAPARAGAEPASIPADAGQRLLREARGHHDMGRFEASLRALELAARSSDDDRFLAQVQLQRGVNLAVLGRTAEARQAFALALEKDSSVELDPTRVKPAIVSLLRSLRSERAAGVESRRSSPPAGEAEVSLVRPGTRPFAATLAVGGAAGIGGAAGGFALYQELAYHPSRSARGLAVALAIGESFGSKGEGPPGTAPRVSLYQVGAKLSWDLQPSARSAFYLSPLLQVAFVHATSAVVGASESAQALALRAGLEVKLILDDRFLLTLRPAGLEVLVGSAQLARVLSEAGEGAVMLRLDFAVGAGVIF
jgi:tetratricopeptide (TPR) repeat protein